MVTILSTYYAMSTHATKLHNVTSLRNIDVTGWRLFHHILDILTLGQIVYKTTLKSNQPQRLNDASVFSLDTSMCHLCTQGAYPLYPQLNIN